MLEPEVDPNQLSRLELLRLAQNLRVADADVMTRAELRAAIEKARRPPQSRQRAEPVTWVSVARRLLASIVEQGLNLPDAAALIRGDTKLSQPPTPPPPVATVTLARIYAAQGHLARAITTLDEVLTSDPDHDIARELRSQLSRRLEQLELDQLQASARPADNAARRAANGARSAEGSEPPRAEGTTTGAASEPEAPAATEPTAATAEATAATPEPTAAAPEPAAASLEPAATSSEPAAVTEPMAAPSEAAADSAVDSMAATVAEVPADTEAPGAPALVVIETEAPGPYVYWELDAPRAGTSSEPHWLCVVSHTPSAAGSVRQERQFPVHERAGALRLQGLPARAVVRAKLSKGRAPEERPLAVAACVQLAEGSTSGGWVTRFAPRPLVDAAALSHRAQARLPDAKPVYW